MYDNEARTSMSRHGGSAGCEASNGLNTPAGPIRTEVSMIAASLDRLDMATEALAEFLSPILVAAPGTGDAEKADPASIACPHHGDLVGFASRLDANIKRLESLANRIAF